MDDPFFSLLSISTSNSKREERPTFQGGHFSQIVSGVLLSHFQLLCNSQHQSVNHHCQSTHLLIISLSNITVSLHFHSSSVYVNHHCQSTLSFIISLSTTTVSLHFHSSSVCQPPLSVYTFTHHQSVNHHCQSPLSLIIRWSNPEMAQSGGGPQEA